MCGTSWLAGWSIVHCRLYTRMVWSVHPYLKKQVYLYFTRTSIFIYLCVTKKSQHQSEKHMRWHLLALMDTNLVHIKLIDWDIQVIVNIWYTCTLKTSSHLNVTHIYFKLTQWHLTITSPTLDGCSLNSIYFQLSIYTWQHPSIQIHGKWIGKQVT